MGKLGTLFAAVSTALSLTLLSGSSAPVLAQIAAPQSSVVIQSGDTLEAIALRHGTTIAALQRANPGLDPLALQVGQRLRLPPPQNAVRIEAGDTLEAIALRQGTTVAELQQANPAVRPEALQVGQWLRLPAGRSNPRLPSAPSSPAAAALTPGPDPAADPYAQAALLLSPGERRDRAAMTLRERNAQVQWRRFSNTLVDWSGWQLHPGGVRITLVQPALADVGARRSGATAIAVQCSSLRNTWRVDGTWERWASPEAGSVAQNIVLQLCSNTLDGPAAAIPPPPDSGS